MRYLRLLPLLLTVIIIYLLDTSHGVLPALGRVLDPINGAMAAAEPAGRSFNLDLKIKGLRAPVDIWLEDRLVPHIRAQNNHDLYLAEGYIHAYFRLWQMDFQAHAASGRISELIGARAIEFDRLKRRSGMVWGAEHSLATMMAEPRTKEMLEAYTEGINTYIHSLNYRSLPIEYKLIGYAPEDWTPLNTALMMKAMADDLTGKTDDIAFTILRDNLGQKDFDFLFPEKIQGSKPVIPEGTTFTAPTLPIPQYPGDQVWAHFNGAAAGKPVASGTIQPYPTSSNNSDGTGSNNWAISGAHTASGAPILCNDPHLALSLPSLWFEIQLTAPGINTYGASLPGAPGVVIGFNDSLSWGLTNNYRDVKDFYDITLADPSAKAYSFDGRPIPFDKKTERIKIKGAADMLDTVRYTLHGPVLYDPTFPDPANSGKYLACTWMAHRGSNELLAVYLLNRAQNYAAFTDAISHFTCPAQNFAYSDRRGNIAMWGQGQFINKWRGQGRFVMEGKDSATLWGQDIPMAENPHVLNPAQGYVASANQSVTDSAYPYWYNGMFFEFRAWEINRILGEMNGKHTQAAEGWASATIENVEGMQNSIYSLLGQSVQPAINNNLTEAQRKLVFERYINAEHSGGSWLNGDLSAENINATVFQIFWSQLYKAIWQNKFTNTSGIRYPSEERTMQLILTDSASKWYDDAATPQHETLRDLMQRAFKETADSLDKLKATGLEWYKVKNTTVRHLARIMPFSYEQLQIGGWSNTINACTQDHGPSWRMIVEMGRDSIRSYGVYPGGQSGNPGSIHYGDFIDFWTKGKYYSLQFSNATTTQNPFKYTWSLHP